MSRLTTHPAPARATHPEPAPGLLSSPLLVRVHLAVTALLLAALLTVLVLAGVGLLRFRKAEVAANSPAKEESAEKETPPEGRYQIQASDEARAAVGLGLDGMHVPAREVWVFRYKGGFLQCKLEADSVGPDQVCEVPRDWSNLIGGIKELADGNPELNNREGYVVLVAMPPSVQEDLSALHPHLGAIFTPGPAGPLHSLVPYYHEIWRACQYRLFLSARVPEGRGEGRGFTARKMHNLLIHSQFNNDDVHPASERTHVTVGKAFEAGKELTILERQRGLTTVRLKARFLTDEEVAEKAKAEPE